MPYDLIMKKIGLVTYWNNNFGSVLQCYATKTIIQRMGYKCEVLVEEPRGFERYFSYMKKSINFMRKFIIYPESIETYRELKQSVIIANQMMPESVKFDLNLFCVSELQPRKYGPKDLKYIGESSDYVAFIAGSDQIWNGAFPYNPFYFLNFANPEKRIALAPSFGTDKVEPYNKKEFKKSISGFRILSTREESGKEIIYRLTKRKAVRIADPVVMLSKEEWLNFARGGNAHERPYIFTFFLDQPNELVLQSIIQLMNESPDKHDVINFAYHYENILKLDNTYMTTGGPRDYLSLINNADVILTDSFHTALFSIIFNRPFYVYSRSYRHSYTQSDRLINLLQIYKCQDRMINNINSAKKLRIIPLSDCDIILEGEHKRAIEFITKAIQLNDKNAKNYSVRKLRDLEMCTGCAVCESICPVDAIKICKSNEDYMIPIINEEICLECGICSKYCLTNIPQKNRMTHSFIVYAKNNELRKNSASGGVFQVVARRIIQNGGIVFGAGMIYENGHVFVRHMSAENFDQLNIILNSKYVESDCSGIYPQVLKELKTGRLVLYSGTSCQIEALYRFLGENDYTNLYTIDLICHGVPGRYFFENYIKYLEEKNKKKIINFSFRNKQDKDFYKERVWYVFKKKSNIKGGGIGQK